MLWLKCTRRSPSGKESGLSSTTSIAENTAELMPMPTARVATTAAVKRGVRTRLRAARHTLCRSDPIGDASEHAAPLAKQSTCHAAERSASVDFGGVFALRIGRGSGPNVPLPERVVSVSQHGESSVAWHTGEPFRVKHVSRARCRRAATGYRTKASARQSTWTGG